MQIIRNGEVLCDLLPVFVTNIRKNMSGQDCLSLLFKTVHQFFDILNLLCLCLLILPGDLTSADFVNTTPCKGGRRAEEKQTVGYRKKDSKFNIQSSRLVMQGMEGRWSLIKKQAIRY